MTNPLEDRKLALLTSLRDLEASREDRAIEDLDYAQLRAETDARLTRVLRALDAREAEAARVARAVHDPASAEPRRWGPPRWAAVAVVAGTIAAVIGSSLLLSIRPRAEGAPITGTDPLSFFVHRVQQQPHDVGARLDLAHQYLQAGALADSARQFLAALQLHPNDAEAMAYVGLLEHLDGQPERGLQFVDRALAVEPGYPDALFFKGVILLRGLDRPVEAVAALQAYLRAAPFGVNRPDAEALIREARASGAVGSG